MMVVFSSPSLGAHAPKSEMDSGLNSYSNFGSNSGLSFARIPTRWLWYRIGGALSMRLFGVVLL
jgi:hypothetical protein